MASERTRTASTVTAMAAMAATILFLLGAFISTGAGGTKIILAAVLLAVAAGGVYSMLLLKRLQRSERSNTQLTVELRSSIERETDLRTQLGQLLREPLTSIVTDADLLINRPDTPITVRRDLLASIQRNARDVEALLDDLSRAGRASVTTVPVKSVILLDKEAESLVASDLTSAELTIECEPARAWGDPAKVRQVLRTLVTLSTQNEGAQITVQTAQRGEAATATISGKGAILPEHALAALSDEPTDHIAADSSDGRFEALRATRNLVVSMGGDISAIHAFGDSHIVVTLPSPGPEPVVSEPRRPVTTEA